jgi:hypothetical protein
VSEAYALSDDFAFRKLSIIGDGLTRRECEGSSQETCQ